MSGNAAAAVTVGLVQHKEEMGCKQGLVCAILVGNAATCGKADEIAASMQGCPYVGLYVASERLVVGVFAIPVSKQWWIEYPQEHPELLGLEQVLVHVTDHIEASSPWTRGKVEPILSGAPCGTACSRCPMYGTRCRGCPATIWYEGG